MGSYDQEFSWHSFLNSRVADKKLAEENIYNLNCLYVVNTILPYVCFPPKLYFLNLKEEYYIRKDIYNIICNGEKTDKQHKCPTIKGNWVIRHGNMLQFYGFIKIIHTFLLGCVFVNQWHRLVHTCDYNCFF